MSTDVTTPAPARTPTLTPGPGRPGRRERFALLRGRADTKVSPYVYIAPFFVAVRASSGSSRWSTRPGCRCTTGSWPAPSTRGPAWTTTGSWSPTRCFWNALGNTVGIFVLVDRAAAAAGAGPGQPAQPAAARARRSSGCRCPAPDRHLAWPRSAIVFSQLFSRDFGLVNWVLGVVGVRRRSTGRRPSGRPGRRSPLMVDWRWTGYNALIYLAAHAGHPARPLRGGRARRRRRVAAVLADHRPAAAPDDHLHGHHLHHRRHPAVHRAAAVQLRLVQRISGGSLRQFQTLAMYICENAFVDSSTSATPSAVAWVLFLIIVLAAALNFLAVRRLGGKD